MKKLIIAALAATTLAAARPAAAHLSIAIGIPGFAVVAAAPPPPPVLYRPAYYYDTGYRYPAYYAPAPIVFREGRRHGCRHGWHHGRHWDHD